MHEAPPPSVPDLSQPSEAALAWLEAAPRLVDEEQDWVDPAFSVDRMRRDHGDRTVSVSDTLHKDRSATTKLSHFIEYCLLADPERPLYLHWWFGPEAETLRAALTPPWYLRSWFDALPLELDPQLVWYLAGPKGSGSKWHRDIWGTTAWCRLLEGRKRWQFAPPAPGAPAEPRSGPTLSFDQKPGQLVYVPSGWRHAVRNLAPSFAISGNAVNAANHRSVRAALADRPSWAAILDRLQAHASA